MYMCVYIYIYLYIDIFVGHTESEDLGRSCSEPSELYSIFW